MQITDPIADLLLKKQRSWELYFYLKMKLMIPRKTHL